MKWMMILPIFWSTLIGLARAQDSASKVAAGYFREAEDASRGQHIWNAQVYGPMLFVDPETRMTYANMPDSAGILKPVAGIYQGILPSEVMIANTAIDWEGKKWSVILWPLMDDRDERDGLLMHESFHRIQAGLGLPERGPTVDHLSTMEGRIYFLLELQALKSALLKPTAQRSEDLTNALIFREKRQELFPATFANERILEMSEGLAEYTGVIIGRRKEGIRQHLIDQIDTAANRKSFIRSCAYITGPVYGYLLYEKAPGWTLKVDSNDAFPQLIARYYHIAIPDPPTPAVLSLLEKKYNGDHIIPSEKQKEAQRLQIVAQYTEMFTQKPVLTITLQKMGISFNPNTLFDLGAYGTVYPTAEVKDRWGKLVVSSNGMLMKDWKVVTLPAGEELNIDGKNISGKGWSIVLNDGWEMTKNDPIHYTLVEKK